MPALCARECASLVLSDGDRTEVLRGCPRKTQDVATLELQGNEIT